MVEICFARPVPVSPDLVTSDKRFARHGTELGLWLVKIRRSWPLIGRHGSEHGQTRSEFCQLVAWMMLIKSMLIYAYRVHYFKLDKKVVHDAESQFSAKVSVRLGNCSEDGVKSFLEDFYFFTSTTFNNRKGDHRPSSAENEEGTSKKPRVSCQKTTFKEDKWIVKWGLQKFFSVNFTYCR